MFESYEEEQRRSGFKGFVNRHFGPVIHADIAEEGIRQIGVVFMVLAALSGILGAARGTPLALVQGLVLVFTGFMLYLTKSRIAAVFLLVVSVLNAVLLLPRWAPLIWVAFAIRATQLTFGYRRLLKEKAAVLSAME
jgi:O-antigen ligase